jgi:hypothetical protein
MSIPPSDSIIQFLSCTNSGGCQLCVESMSSSACLRVISSIISDVSRNTELELIRISAMIFKGMRISCTMEWVHSNIQVTLIALGRMISCTDQYVTEGTLLGCFTVPPTVGGKMLWVLENCRVSFSIFEMMLECTLSIEEFMRMI